MLFQLQYPVQREEAHHNMDSNITPPAGGGLPPVPPNPIPSQNTSMPAQPAAAPVVAQAGEGGDSSSKKWIFIILGVIGLLAVVGGAYFFLMGSQTAQPAQQNVQVDTTEFESLNAETSQINLGDIQSDFVEVDTDLQSL